MDHIKKDIIYFIIFMIALFIGWVITGGPQKAHESGSDHNVLQKPVGALDTGETYNSNIRDVEPVEIKPLSPTGY